MRSGRHWRDEDESEVLLFYEFPWIDWQVEFQLDGSFNCILVTSKPMRRSGQPMALPISGRKRLNSIRHFDADQIMATVSIFDQHSRLRSFAILAGLCSDLTGEW